MKWRSFITVLTLTISTFTVHAKSSEWFTKIMASKEQGVLQHTAKEEPKTRHHGFFREHGLILFYASQCPHCHLFAPILKSWAVQNEVEILPLAFDNQPLPEFPNFLPATTEWINAAFQGKPITYPALFVVNPKTKMLFPVGFGSMTQDELNYRMEHLIPKITSYERSGVML
ncbi:type-F conjugative transfer system pilin assembly thiol-disulfide isomerase TrbB [Legionella qingyii]|uniref:Type-F conjugative transfer system pilin assembly thiol-disulfide isomerase TrbB n=1 Tax=Legionella qingyii TaxID=2184757 RepID=A0A317TXW6_9GAMM|nr:type-F conjugative transfer system pilin assembly thiol-disulfide isomerase TrbB [Legionella qingyii]PWY53809.1 type-F conjugative transfer system pilin assembly thiol-disulfide isomerase TrbB [Legionella qingyii]RUR21120.1 type-F conjugative transfer system pilin assembly thiol-disulfide isomerase TrbB [Legionella qingyii]